MIPLVSHAPSSIANSAPREDGDANQINNNNTNNTNNNVEGRSSRKKSNVYIQALASDSINEVHPQRLNLYLEVFHIKTYFCYVLYVCTICGNFNFLR